MSETVLKMENITKKFPGVIALKNVNISINKQEVVSIIGENGAGKSTLMKVLSGAYSCSSYEGKININGSEKRIYSTKDSEEYGIQMIYQENNPFLDLSIAENVFMGNYFRKKNKTIDWKKVYCETERLLKVVNLDIDPKVKMRDLNGSQQQMVAIIKAISRNINILILDEPTSSLTKEEVENLFKIINKLKNEGISCIYISHKLDEIFEISDRIIVMRDGMVVDNLNKEEFNYDDIITKMIGRKLSEMYPVEKHDIGKELFRIENFTVKHPYNNKENILEDISFSLGEGEILGLVGLVGSGRSELVKAIFGYDKKISGKVYIEGEEVSINTPKDAVRNNIALITEDRKKDGLNLIQNISKNLTIASMKKVSQNNVIRKNKEKIIVDKYMKDLDIRAISSKVKVVNLSGGNQQKVVLGKWLMTEPKILILDEPTRGIDVGAKAEIYRKISDLAKQGKGIILISSEFPELTALCDRYLILRHGKIVQTMMKHEANETSLLLGVSGVD